MAPLQRPLVPRDDRLEEGASAFLDWVFAQDGMRVGSYRGRSLSRRLAACLRHLRARSLHEARRVLEAQPELIPAVMDTLLLGVTDFFRDPEVFAALRTIVLPDLATSRERLRIWSAACSEGQELYSIAILLAECGSLPRADLLGTDCRATAIARAVQGIYRNEDLDGIDEALRRRYFETLGGRRRAVEILRRSIRWRRHDLFGGAMAGPWDVIMWRNMSIYLQDEAGLSVWHALAAHLRSGGYVVTGKADHPPRELRWTRVAPCIYKSEESFA